MVIHAKDKNNVFYRLSDSGIYVVHQHTLKLYLNIEA